MKKRQGIQSSIEDKFKEKYLGSKQEMILSRREIFELIDYKQFISSWFVTSSWTRNVLISPFDIVDFHVSA